MADFLDDATIIAHESGGRPYIGWRNTDLTPYIQAGKVTPQGFPDWPGLPGPAGTSTAAGLYGITKTNWNHYAPGLGVTDFTPESQKKVKDAIMADQGPNAWLPYWSKHRSADKGLPQSEGYYGGATHLNVGGSEGPGQAGTGGDLAAFALLDNLITKQRYAADAEPPQSGNDLLSLIAAGAQTRQEGPKPQEASQEPKPLTPPPAPAPDPGNVFSSHVEPPDQGALPPAPVMPSFPQGEPAAPPMPPGEAPTINDNSRQLPTEPTKPPQSGTELLQSLMGNGAPVVEPGLMPPAEPGKFDTSLAELGKNLLQHLVIDPVKQGYETTENVLAGKGFTPEEATGVASLAMGGSIGRGGMGAGPRLPGGPREPPTGFTTAKGSRYELHEDGTTTRNKSFHPEHGPVDQGPQPRSEATIFVSPEDAIKLGEFQSQGGPARVVAPLGDGRWGVKYTEGKDAGKFESRTVVTPQPGLAVGLTPVEIWRGGQRVHFGNEITAVQPSPAGTGRAEPPPLLERPTGGGSPARAAGGIAEATPSVSETQAPATAAGSGFRPPTGTLNPTAGSGVNPNLPAITNVKLAQSLDDDLYKLQQNRQADMIEARQMVEGLPKEWLDPEVQERAYTEREARMADPKVEGSELTQGIERALAPLDQKISEDANWIRQNASDVAGELPDLPTAEEGYVHRKVMGRNAPGERLGPQLSDPITGIGGRSLSRRASGVMHRTQNYVIQDAAGNRVWQKGELGGKGELARYGETFTDPRSGKKWTAKPPTTAEIEANTGRQYQKNLVANTTDNFLRLRSVRRNIELLQQWKPKLEAAGHFVPEGASRDIPKGFQRVDLPQLRGHAEPHIASVLNDFYGAAKGDLDGFLARANKFLIGTMFALPVRHIENVGAHYIVGRGFDWLYSNPMLARASRAVASQSPEYIRLLREGAGLMYPSTLNENFYGTLLEKVFRDQIKSPEWGAIAKALGFDKVSDLVKAEYAWSRRTLWKVNDIFLTARIMELEGKGMPLQQAIRQAEKEIPNYRIPSEVMGKQWIAQLLKGPYIAFGRYSYGRGKTLAEMVKDMVGKEATGEERVRALGQATVLALVGTSLYSVANAALNMALQQMGYTGKDMELSGMGPFGITRMAPGYIGQKLGLTEDQTTFAQMLSQVIILSPLSTMIGTAASAGKDMFTGKPLVNPESSTVGQATQFGEALARPIYPLQVGIDAARKGILPAVGPQFGVKQTYEGPPGKVKKMLRRGARREESRDPIQGGIGSAMEYLGLQ